MFADLGDRGILFSHTYVPSESESSGIVSSGVPLKYCMELAEEEEEGRKALVDADEDERRVLADADGDKVGMEEDELLIPMFSWLGSMYEGT